MSLQVVDYIWTYVGDVLVLSAHTTGIKLGFKKRIQTRLMS